MAKVKVSNRPVGRPALIQAPLIAWMVDVGQWTINWMQKNNRIATGRSINSFEVDVQNKPTVVTLSAAESVAYALEGRKSGKAPPIIAIENWVRAKGIARGQGEVTLNSIAWAIRAKIAKKGTNPPKLRPQNITLVINQKGIKYLNQLGDNLAKEVSDLMVASLTKNNPNTTLKK